MISRKSLLASIALTLTAIPFSAVANIGLDRNSGRFAPRQIDMNRAMRNLAPSACTFGSSRDSKVQMLNAKMDRRLGDKASGWFRATEQNPNQPANSIGPTQNFYDIDGPNGKIWYCSTELSCTEIVFELYTEQVLREYKVTIYDENFEVVGTIHDKMRYDEGEVRVPGPYNGFGVLPIVTKNYFNSDDLYEIVISLAVNTETPGLNNYRSIVYSLGGEKETVTVDYDGNQVQIDADKPLMRIDSFVANVADLSTPGNEEIYMTFEEPFGEFIDIDWEKLLDGDEAEGEKYWESMSTNGISYRMFSKAGADGKLNKIFEKTVTYQTMQGDQENSPSFLTFVREGKAYLLFPYYKETFYNPFYSPFDEEMSMRESNTLVLDMYTISPEKTEFIFSTEIPVVKETGETILATYYSVGDLRYTDDVVMTDPENAEFIITRCNYSTGSDELAGYCFNRYNKNGQQTSTIFEQAESYMTISDVEEKDPVALFVRYDDDEGYLYNFVNLENPQEKATINYLLDVEGELNVLGFNCDRTRIGDSYMYAFELRQPYVDFDERAYMQIAWFNADGSFDRVDFVDMGTLVNYATVNLDGEVLNPDFTYADPQKKHEYMVLIKRAIGADVTEAQEELLIAQPVDPHSGAESQVMLHATPCEKGDLSLLNIYPGSAENTYRLMVSYNGENGYTADFYDLPFANTGICNPATDDAENLKFDGNMLAGSGKTVIYSSTGAKVAESVGSLDTSVLPSGVYIATCGGSALKFVVR